ncbi:MAG TPA: hypothetical protein VGS41_17505, partial [Chthonomonadales bacterium]|nr:hypothetical protein [Chthonomonadales bacterium]
MADNTSMPDISSLLAPWMQTDPFSPASYGGAANMGAAMLSAAGPLPYKQPFLVGLGKAMQSGQANALQNAQQRMGLAGNSLMLQRQMAMWPMMSAIMNRMAGGTGVASAAQPAQASADSQGAAPASDADQSAPAPSGTPAPSSAPWMGGGMDPFEESQLGALGAMAGIPGATEAQKDASLRLQYDPGLATSMAFSKSPVAQDMMMMNQAARAQNPQLSQMALTKLRNDMGTQHIGSMSGIRTYQEPDGSWTTINPSTGLRVNDREGASLLPGMTSALQEKAAAEAQGEATAQTVEVTDKDGNKYLIPKSAVVGRGARQVAPQGAAEGPFGNGATAAAPSAGVTPFQAEIGPSKSAMLHGNATNAVEANKEYQTQAEAGQQMLVQTQELRDAAADFTPGQFAESRMKMLQYLNSMHLITPEQLKSLGSAQAGQKIAIQLQAAATKQLGSREAAQIFTYMGKSLPNLTLSTDGLAKVSGYMDGIARYNMARAQVAQQRSAANDANGVNNVRNDFIKNTNPLYFVVASSPPDIQKEIVQSMGKQAPTFLAQWNAAAKAGWAPRPTQYWSGNAP